MIHHTLRWPVALLLIALIASCDDPQSPNPPELEQELITHVTLRLIDSATMIDTAVATFIDEDGANGPKSPMISGMTLASGRTYLGSIHIEDRSNTSAEDISEEIRELATQHQFFYSITGEAEGRVTTEILDTDTNGLPLGLSTRVRVTPGSSTQGGYRVILSHYEKPELKTGTSQGESDIDITFPITIR